MMLVAAARQSAPRRAVFSFFWSGARRAFAASMQEQVRKLERFERERKEEERRRVKTSESPDLGHKRSLSVRRARVRTKIEIVVRRVWYEWMRDNELPGVLRGLDFVEIELAPDFRQMYIYWQREETAAAPDVASDSVFADIFDGGGATTTAVKLTDRERSLIEKKLAVVATRLRFAVATQARLRYAPDFIFHEAKNDRVLRNLRAAMEYGPPAAAETEEEEDLDLDEPDDDDEDDLPEGMLDAAFSTVDATDLPPDYYEPPPPRRTTVSAKRKKGPRAKSSGPEVVFTQPVQPRIWHPSARGTTPDENPSDEETTAPR